MGGWENMEKIHNYNTIAFIVDDNNNYLLLSLFLVFYESYELKVNIRKLRRKKNSKEMTKKTANDHSIVFRIVCCVYYLSSMLFPTTLTHIERERETYIKTKRKHTHIHIITSKYRLADMYLLLRLIVLNLAHKNSNVFAHQKVFFSTTSKNNLLCVCARVSVCLRLRLSAYSLHSYLYTILKAKQYFYFVNIK